MEKLAAITIGCLLFVATAFLLFSHTTTPPSPLIHRHPPLPLSVAVFVAPHSPFRTAALTYWLYSLPSARIYLLGDHPTFSEVALSLRDKATVSVERHIDSDYQGKPQLHSMFARARRTEADVSVLVMDPNVRFSDNFAAAIRKTLAEMPNDWVLFSRNPAELNGGVEFWAWNNVHNQEGDDNPLFTSPLPPFYPVVGTYEDWVMQHLSEQRSVVDATDANLTVRFRNNYGKEDEDKEAVSAESMAAMARMNEMLAVEGRSNETFVAVPSWRLKRCSAASNDGGGYGLCLLAQREQTTPLTMAASPPLLLPKAEDRRRTLAELLPEVADEDKVVVMVGGTWNYRHMLLNFVCRAQSVGVKSVLVAAFDDALFDFAFRHGLGVYLESASEKDRKKINGDGGCAFATDCFKRVSKLKSVSVLRVLKLGYSVLWSDLDIYWFRNPVPELKKYGGPETLVIQSDEPSENKPENSISGANSGFYLARSDEATVAAVEAIVRHAMGTEMTEQPSFYDVLCGEKGERRMGKRECWWRNNSGEGGLLATPLEDTENGVLLRTVFLNHREYPNGNVYGYWGGNGTTAAEYCEQSGCVVLHNNFIRGREAKMRRLVMNGMWLYDGEQGMCLQPWNPLHPSTYSSLATYQSHFLAALHLSAPPLSNHHSAPPPFTTTDPLVAQPVAST